MSSESLKAVLGKPDLFHDFGGETFNISSLSEVDFVGFKKIFCLLCNHPLFFFQSNFIEALDG